MFSWLRIELALYWLPPLFFAATLVISIFLFRKCGRASSENGPKANRGIKTISVTGIAVSSLGLLVTGMLFVWSVYWFSVDWPELTPIQNINLRNETSEEIHVRYEAHECDEPARAAFDESIRFNDPRLKYRLAPSESESIPTMLRERSADDKSQCHRLGSAGESGDVLLLSSFTGVEMEERDWTIVITE